MKLLVLTCIVILVIGIGLSLRGVDTSHELDMLEVNRVVQYIETNYPAALPDHFNAIFIEAGDSLHTFIQNQDIIVPILIDGQMAGSVVFSNEISEATNRMQTQLSVIFYAQAALLAIMVGLFALYQYATLLRPFRKLEHFAARVAAGDLASPLEMDRKNRFGAFSESFDLMREQLATAKENERLADKAKKELVASLSHDIKTPAASIKIIAELYQAKYGETKEMASIINKVDHIDMLISNMFSATLEELTQLKVSPTEVSTVELEQEIRTADFKNKIRPFTLPECVLTVDRLRFRQVIDNVIGNSYKYANTEMEVYGDFEGDTFVLAIRDFGAGVLEDEISLLCEKFYRAKNAANESGTGLGLYLSQYFVSEMGGTLTVENNGGLCVVMRFPI